MGNETTRWKQSKEKSKKEGETHVEENDCGHTLNVVLLRDIGRVFGFNLSAQKIMN
jgi:hypothetical protein